MGSSLSGLTKFTGEMCQNTMYGFEASGPMFTVDRTTGDTASTEYSLPSVEKFNKSVWDPVNEIYIVRSDSDNVIAYTGINSSIISYYLDTRLSNGAAGLFTYNGGSYYVNGKNPGSVNVKPFGDYIETFWPYPPDTYKLNGWSDNIQVLAFFNSPNNDSMLYALTRTDYPQEEYMKTNLAQIVFYPENKTAEAVNLGDLEFPNTGYFTPNVSSESERIELSRAATYYDESTGKFVIRLSVGGDDGDTLEWSVFLSRFSTSSYNVFSQTVLGDNDDFPHGAIPCHQEYVPSTTTTTTTTEETRTTSEETTTTTPEETRTTSEETTTTPEETTTTPGETTTTTEETTTTTEETTPPPEETTTTTEETTTTSVVPKDTTTVVPEETTPPPEETTTTTVVPVDTTTVVSEVTTTVVSVDTTTVVAEDTTTVVPEVTTTVVPEDTTTVVLDETTTATVVAEDTTTVSTETYTSTGTTETFTSIEVTTSTTTVVPVETSFTTEESSVPSTVSDPTVIETSVTTETSNTTTKHNNCNSVDACNCQQGCNNGCVCNNGCNNCCNNSSNNGCRLMKLRGSC